MMLLGLIDVPLWVILGLAVVISLYVFMSRRYRLFTSLGIPGPKPWPFVGNIVQLINRGLMKYDFDLRREYGNVIGTFLGMRPQLLIFDEDMISQVTVKEFHNFTNRTTSEMGEELMDKNLLNLKDEKWKKMRSIMSPTFTTGKLKLMSAEINRCAKEMTEVLSSQEEFEGKDSSGAYTMSVIASTAFGLKVNSQVDKDNLFIKHGKAIMGTDLKNPVIWLAIIMPSAMKYVQKIFGRSFFPTEPLEFFREILRQTVENRGKEIDKSRTDYIQLMVNAQNGEDIRDEAEKNTGDTKTNSSDITTAHIMANAFIFFLAGYETTSQGLSLLLYNLATNQDCQQKLFEEIERVMDDEEDVSYSKVTQMPYLEQCINESLRMYPPAPRIERNARNDIEINGFKIPKGVSVNIPVYALQNDPQIWNEPERFNPDRFSPEEKAKRNPIYWMPFGYGPRNCIGLRLALFEIKVAIVHIIRKHKLVTCEKTKVPIEFDKMKWLKVKDGLWLKLAKRSEV